jgi:hypothetical protein
VNIDAATQEEAFKTQISEVPGAQIITEMVAESIRIGSSTYNPGTRILNLEGLRMHISNEGFIRLC